MELLFVAALLLSSGLAYCAYRQRRELQEIESAIKSRDQVIGQLQSQVESLERDKMESPSTRLDRL